MKKKSTHETTVENGRVPITEVSARYARQHTHAADVRRPERLTNSVLKSISWWMTVSTLPAGSSSRVSEAPSTMNA